MVDKSLFLYYSRLCNRGCNKQMHEWLSGGVSPCQGEGRGFESRLALSKSKRAVPIWHCSFAFFESDPGLEGSKSTLRFGRCKAKVPRTLCAPSRALFFQIYFRTRMGSKSTLRFGRAPSGEFSFQVILKSKVHVKGCLLLCKWIVLGFLKEYVIIMLSGGALK